MRAVAVLMTLVMIVAILSSIAIVRRILMATSVLKASKQWKTLRHLLKCGTFYSIPLFHLSFSCSWNLTENYCFKIFSAGCCKGYR